MPDAPPAPPTWAPRYTTLDAFESWTRANLDGMPDSTPDDTSVQLCISRAEETIDCYCGSAFDAFSGIERARKISVGGGWMTIQMYRPIVAVSKIETIDTRGVATWATVATDQLILEDLGLSARMGNYWFEAHVPGLPTYPSGRLLARVTYTAGYTDIPYSLQGICNSLAAFYYKRRELPTGAGAIPGVGAVAAGLEMPADLMAALDGWKNVAV
jgi:hypothetical protein